MGSGIAAWCALRGATAPEQVAGWDAACATVRIGNNYATSITVAGTTNILATTPAGPAGVIPIVVTNSDGQAAVLASGFTYTAAAAPTITSVAPIFRALASRPLSSSPPWPTSPHTATTSQP